MCCSLNRDKIAALAISHRLPSMFGVREYVEAGGLMSYGESFGEFFRLAAFYVDKIIKGAKPGDLPIEQPNRYYLTINRKTARALGLKLADSLLGRADVNRLMRRLPSVQEFMASRNLRVI